MSFTGYLWTGTSHQKSVKLAVFLWIVRSLWWNQNQNLITWWDAALERKFREMRLARVWRRFDKSELSKSAPRFSMTAITVRWLILTDFGLSYNRVLKAMREYFQYFLKVGLWTWHPLTTRLCSFKFFSASRVTSFWRKVLLPSNVRWLPLSSYRRELKLRPTLS